MRVMSEKYHAESIFVQKKDQNVQTEWVDQQGQRRRERERERERETKKERELGEGEEDITSYHGTWQLMAGGG